MIQSPAHFGGACPLPHPGYAYAAVDCSVFSTWAYGASIWC